jgi:hypothetical protein
MRPRPRLAPQAPYARGPSLATVGGVALLLVAAFAVTLLAACRGEEASPAQSAIASRNVEGPPRGFQMGFSATPRELTDEAYIDTFDLAAAYGETLMLQRVPSWQDFLPGASISDDYRDQILADRDAARERGLDIIVVLDPFDPAARGQLQAPPEGKATATFADDDIAAAFRAEALFIARNVEPTLLVLANEVNSTFEIDPDAYEAFVEVYASVYDALHAASDVPVAVSFQYEELLGVIPWQLAHPERWDLFDHFDGRLDALPITTFPSFAFSVARKVPPRYYQQIREHSDLPIVWLAVGYASTPGRDGLNGSTPPEQRRFLERLLIDVDRMRSDQLIWFAIDDLTFATLPPQDLIASIGLRDEHAVPKEAWDVWVEASRRPIDPPAAWALVLQGDAERALAEAVAASQESESSTNPEVAAEAAARAEGAANRARAAADEAELLSQNSGAGQQAAFEAFLAAQAAADEAAAAADAARAHAELLAVTAASTETPPPEDSPGE